MGVVLWIYSFFVYYSQLCLMEGLIFYHFTAFKSGTFRVRMHDFSILPFYSSEQCPPHSLRTVQLRSALYHLHWPLHAFLHIQ